MRRRIAQTIVRLMLAAPALAGCGAAPPAPLPEGAVAWKLIPIAVETRPAGDGWTDYSVQLALENHGSAEGVAPTDTTGVVETQEGTSYEAQLKGAAGWSLPPGFRVVGVISQSGGVRQVDPAVLLFRAAAAEHPLLVRFKHFGVVDLRALQSPVFPTERPREEFRQIGETIALVIDAEVTVTRAALDGTTLTIAVRYQNLDQQFDMTPNFGCRLFDGRGYVRSGDWGSQRYYTPLLPDQMIERRVEYRLGAPDVGAGVRALMTNAKLVCQGDYDGKGTYSTQAIFNLD